MLAVQMLAAQEKHSYREIRSEAENFHHLLFQRKHWQQGYALRLREHPYMGFYLPQDTLHAALHSKIHDVPTPNASDCRRAFYELSLRERAGEIDYLRDPIEKRIDFLLEMWKEVCPATVAILQWQRDLIMKYYARH